jgi:hypothetical protein
MARVNQRLWKIPGQRTKRKAWGFTAQINGKQVRRYKAEWTQDDAEAELAKALLKIEPEKPKGPGITLDQTVDRPGREVEEAVAVRGQAHPRAPQGLLREGHAARRDHGQPHQRIQRAPALDRAEDR